MRLISSSQSFRILVSIGILTLTGGGCSAVTKFIQDKPQDKSKAAIGERLSIAAFEQKLEPSKSLKGVGFYIPEPEAISEWPSASAVHPDNLAVAEKFKIAWTRQIGKGSADGTSLISEPVSDGTYIYTLDAGARVSATSVETGKPAWSKDLDPKIKRDKVGFGGGLALYGGKLFVTSGYRFVAALDADSGAQVWKKTIDTQVHAAPIAQNQLVVITDVDNQIFAFDSLTGEMKWTFQAIAEPARVLRSAAPIIVENSVIAPLSSGELVSLDLASGQQIWSQTLSQSSRSNALSQIRDISGHPVLHQGLIYAASHAGSFVAIDPKQGQIKWSLAADSVNAPWVSGDVVYLMTVQGELICVNRQSGQVYWVNDINKTSHDKPAKKKIIRDNDKASLDVSEEVSDVIPKASKKKAKNLPTWTGPVLASGRLLLVSSKGELLALDPKTGAALQSLKIGGGSYLPPMAVNGKLFILTEDAKLVAID